MPIELTEPNAIETQDTDEPVCPYCFANNGEQTQYIQQWDRETTMTCEACERDFFVMPQETVTYSTATLEIDE